jgi:hypothetical protein
MRSEASKFWRIYSGADKESALDSRLKFITAPAVPAALFHVVESTCDPLTVTAEAAVPLTFTCPSILEYFYTDKANIVAGHKSQ